MANVLADHPELASGVLEVVSNALTASQQQVVDLEHKVADLEQRLAEAESFRGTPAASEAEFAALQASYERERASGQQLRAALEERFIELRTKETAVDDHRRIMEEKMEDFRKRTEVLSQEAAAKVSALRTQLATTMTEKAALQRDLEASKRDVSKAFSVLSSANQVLEEKVRTSEAQASARSQELDLRHKLESDLEAARTALASKTEDFTKQNHINDGALKALRKKLDEATGSISATDAARAQLESQLRDLLAGKEVTDQSLNATQATLQAKEQEIRVLQELNTVLHAENVRLHEVSAADRARVEEELVPLQIELSALRVKAADLEEDNRAQLEGRNRHRIEHDRLLREVKELCALREQNGARIDELEEKLYAALEALKAANRDNEKATEALNAFDSRHGKLLDTLKQRLLEISEFKKKLAHRDQCVAKANTTVLQEREEYNNLQLDHETQGKEYNNLQLEYEVQKEDAAHDKAMIRKLEETNKNLRSSVLNAGVQAKQELQRAADDERQRFEDLLHAGRQENVKLYADLIVMKERFASVMAERAALLERLRVLSTTSQPEPTRLDRAEGFGFSHSRRESGYSEQQTESAASEYDRDRYEPELYSSGEDDRDESEMGDEEPQSARSAGSSSDWQQSDPPDFTSPKQERQLYRQFMSNFSRPADRPAFTTLQPIHVVSNPLEIFRHDVPTRRRFLHCPKRTIWCFGERLHALIFAPTHEYWHRSNGWANKSKIDSFVGQKVDFFINQNGYVYYVGTYAVHSMRSVHPPGAKITSDVSQTAIYHATGLGQHEREKVRQCFPDGEIRTECFGLQCVGFDHQLYDRLRERFKSGGDGTNKRKAGTEDLRDDARAKTQRVY